MFQFGNLPLPILFDSDQNNWALLQLSFLIRTSPGHSLLVSLPELIADYHVLHRYFASRHPLGALE